MFWRLLIVAVTWLLGLSANGLAHELSERKATYEAESVAGFVAGVLSADYKVRSSTVVSCSARTKQKAVCRLRWDVSERRGLRRRWRCRTTVTVWLVDPTSSETEWDYGRVTCPRVGSGG